MKQAFKQYLKGSKKQASEPRELTVIMQEYSELASRLGQAYYRKQVIEADISEFTTRIARLDQEAQQRKAKDQDAKPKEDENASQA